MRAAQIFVATLSASHYTYAEATLDQTLPNWMASHGRAFAYFGGIPEILVPDNLKSGVQCADRYDPDINPTYHDMAAYYGTAIVPARPRKPQDKPAVESGVQVVERWILAPMRHQTFYSLQELNKAIRPLLKELNHKPFQKREGSRYSHFKAYEEKTLKPLPAQLYTHATFKRLKVMPDYHVLYEKHHYSVPYSYVGETVELRITAHVIEILAHGQRIASHVRKTEPGVSTLPAHEPERHHKHRTWSPESCLSWASSLGQATYEVMVKLHQTSAHSQKLYHLFLGYLKLARYFGEARVEAACHRALFYGRPSYKSVQEILQKGLDRDALPEASTSQDPLSHANIRGPHYYQ